MKTFLTLCLFFWISVSFGQKIKWGDLRTDEIELKTVDFEGDADLVILEEFGDLIITKYGYEILEYSKIKILTPKGLDLINRSWRYPKNKINNKVSFEKGNVLNFENNEVKIQSIKKSDLLIHSVDEKREELKILFPNVRVGSVIEYQIRIISNADLYSSPWRFQKDFPTLKSSLRLQNASNFKYKIILMGERLHKKYGSKSNQKFWELTNIPSSKTLTHVHNVEDFRERLMLQYDSSISNHGTYYSSTEWSDFKKVLIKEINTSKYKFNAANIASKIPSGNSKEQTLINCIQYLQDNYKWSGQYSISSKDLQLNILAKQPAHTADFNILLKEILSYKKINSFYVIGSFRSRGKLVLEYPAFSRMSNLFLVVDLDQNKQRLIDAASVDPENLDFPDLQFFNNSFIRVDTSADIFLAIEPQLSEVETISEMNFLKSEVQLKSLTRANGYFEEINIPDLFPKNAEFILKYESEIQKNNNWSSKSKIYQTSDLKNIYQVDNPLLQDILHFDGEENRTIPMEFDFPFMETYVLKINHFNQFIVMNEDFNYQESCLDSKIIFSQNIQKLNDHYLVTWQFLLGKSHLNKMELKPFNEFIQKVKLNLNNSLILKKIN